jgi:hypothetical protein
MTDNLRDRIICALLPLRCDLEEPCEECRILACQDADAVIEALGLQEEVLPEETVTDLSVEPIYLPRQSRYVTEWIADE